MSPKNEHSFPFTFVDVPFTDRNFDPKTELFNSDFGCCPYTEPSGTCPKVERLRNKRVRISDVDCTYLFYDKISCLFALSHLFLFML